MLSPHFLHRREPASTWTKWAELSCALINITTFYSFKSRIHFSADNHYAAEEFYFWTLGILEIFNPNHEPCPKTLFLDKKNPGYLQPLPEKNRGNFPGSSLYHIRIRRAVRELQQTRRSGRIYSQPKWPPFPTKYKSATHLKNDEQKGKRTQEQWTGGSWVNTRSSL